MDNNQFNVNRQQTNIIAIVGFIFSFFFSLVGLILSIVGLKKSKELNNGKALSIAGIIISSLSLLYIVFIIIITFFYFISALK